MDVPSQNLALPKNHENVSLNEPFLENIGDCDGMIFLN
jgi:hypothetical protein